ncbi:hypothetical protein [Methylobacter sp.]|uniref:hypothetical protein n=1 Tax=Methylobacter sp. TaxID=2051955 RepID=UPI002FDE2D1C
MKDQSAQTPIERGNITLTLSPSEQDALMRCLYISSLNKLTINDACYLVNLSNKLKFLDPNIGDACRHSAHIPEVPGQGGTNVTDGSIYDFDAFPDSPEFPGQGVTNAIELLKEYLLDLRDYASVMPSEKWVNKVRALVSGSMGQRGNLLDGFDQKKGCN